ncbi:ATP-binding protein [Clostridiaceae bacterium M8S5]|nr:ATP-binding protein [Clostridiaceae bacterium M8S5]
MNTQNNDIIKVTLKKKPEYVSIIRVTASSIANKMGFNIEEIEDIKLALGEACISIIKNSNHVEGEYNISFIINENSLGIKIEDFNNDNNIKDCKNKDDLSFFIINTLMDEVKCDKNDKNITVLLTKNRSNE